MFSFFTRKKNGAGVAEEVKQPNPVTSLSSLPASQVVKIPAVKIVPENFAKPTQGSDQKKITQRLAVRTLQEFQDTHHGLNGKGMAAAPEEIQGNYSQEQPETVDLPMAVILNALPDTVLAESREVLLEQISQEQLVRLPLVMILPMLPSGRVEFSVQQISFYLPEHYLQPAEIVRDTTFQIPLHEVASRIPQEAFMVRVDQRPVDPRMLAIVDPFDLEELSQKPEPMVAEQSMEEEAVITPPTELLSLETGVAELRESIAEEPPVLADMVPETMPRQLSVNSPELDLSFAQTEQFKHFLEKLENEIAVKNNVLLANKSTIEEFMPYESLPMNELGAEQEVKLTPLDELREDEVNAVEPEESDLLSGEKTELGETPSTEHVQEPLQSVPDIEEPEVTDQKIPSPLPTLEPIVASAVEPTDLPLVGQVVEPSQNPDSETTAVAGLESVATEQEEFAGFPQSTTEQVVNLPLRVNELLGIAADYQLTLQEVVSIIRRWPGVLGAALVDKGGLPIVYDMFDAEFAKNLSAFAPKILAKVHELFTDIGLLGTPEIHVPSNDFSIYICRHGEVYFILLHNEINIPVWYSEIIKQILTELSFIPQEA